MIATPFRFPGRWARPLVLALLAAAALRAAPTQLVITVPVGTAGADGLATQLANWRQAGLVSDASLLEAAPAKAPAFAAIAVLEFPTTPWPGAGRRSRRLPSPLA